MLKYILLTFTLVNVCSSQRRHKEEPFAIFDQRLLHNLAYNYLWPWSAMFKGAEEMDASEYAQEPQIISNAEKYEVNMNMKRFPPVDLKVKVKNYFVTVQGRRKEKGNDIRLIASHFIQKFELPPGTKPEEVTAVYNENGVLTITAPKHEVPPPPPERDVPIEVRVPEEKTEKPEVTEETATIQTSTTTPLEQADLVEATTHVGKTRKKELKTTTKTVRDNEVTKGVDGNGLDYLLVDSETE